MAVADQRTVPSSVVGKPTVIVDDLHITYRVMGPRPAGAGNDGASALSRILSRKGTPGMREIKAIKGVTFVANHGDAIGLVDSRGERLHV